MSKIYLIRHGNTFENGEVPVYVGAKTDLALTGEGRRQAREVGKYLKDSIQNNDEVKMISGPLLRHIESADEIAQQITYNSPILVDQRMVEIDYGSWEGMSEQEIILGYKKEFQDWTSLGVWPEHVFKTSLAKMKSQIISFLNEYLSFEKTLVLVTSGGTIRAFEDVFLKNDSENKLSTNKVKTGAVSEVLYTKDGFEIINWGFRP